jgi:hypothetical protein
MKHIRINPIFILILLLAGALLLAGCKQEVMWATGDNDRDGIINGDDNCPELSNPNQADADDDGIGDACDPEPNIPDEAQQPPEPPAEGCPPLDLYATFLPNGQIGIWDRSAVILPDVFTSEATLKSSDGAEIPGTFAHTDGEPWLFNTVDGKAPREEDSFGFHTLEERIKLSMVLHRKLKPGENPMMPVCVEDLVPLESNPANLKAHTLDSHADVQQHMNGGQPATNAAPYDDILAVYPWLDSYPLHSWVDGLSRKVIFVPHLPKLAKLAQAETNDAPVLIQTLSSTTFTYTLPGGTPHPGLEGMPLPPGQIDFGGGAFSLTIADVSKAGNPAISFLYGTGADGIQVFHPGAWTAEPLQINGKNFSVSLAGAWSGVATNSENGETAVWVARGEAEISGNGKTVKLSGPNDGATLALSVVASDGTPAAAETVTPGQLGERFGVYTGAMPGRLTFEVQMAGPFQPWPQTEEMLNGLGWQILLDLDGDPATGATGDFLAAQGLGFEVFCYYYGSETCSLKSATNEKITFPTELFTVTFDPQGRVIMSVTWADLQAIAKEAGVTLDPAKLRWRFSHMNEMLDGIPQDVFPEP